MKTTLNQKGTLNVLNVKIQCKNYSKYQYIHWFKDNQMYSQSLIWVITNVFKTKSSSLLLNQKQFFFQCFLWWWIIFQKRFCNQLRSVINQIHLPGKLPVNILTPDHFRKLKNVVNTFSLTDPCSVNFKWYWKVTSCTLWMI